MVNGEDCDDTNPEVLPGALEVSDGMDNDCDGTSDGSDAWWDTAWSFRVPVTLEAPATEVSGPPIAVEVDFSGALTELGVDTVFEADSIRVVLQDCALGQPELPSQYLDGWVGLFDKVPSEDPEGDGHGTVAFLYDENGDYADLEPLPAGATANVAIYFGTGLEAPTYNTDLAATDTQLSNAVAEANFDATQGGLLDSLYVLESPNVMSQTDSCCGNSIYASGWNIDPQDGEGPLQG